MTQEYATLTIPDVEYSDGTHDLVFEMGIGEENAVQIDQSIRTGFLIDSGLDDAIAFFEGLFDPSDSKTESITYDPGSGQFTTDIQVQTPQDTPRNDGSYFQWGSSPDPDVGPNEHTATGADVWAQQAVFINALRVAAPDSVEPAQLSIGEFSPSGIFDPIDVAVENPSVNLAANTPGIADVSVTLISVLDITDPFDIENQPTK